MNSKEKLYHMTWADEKMEKLEQKGKENWDIDDWEAFCYIEQLRGENGYYDD